MKNEENVVAYWPFDEDEGASTLDVANQMEDSIQYIFNGRNRPNHDPVRVKGIMGNALLFDGYSTWLSRSYKNMFNPGKAVTIEVWVAPRSYEHGDEDRLSAIVNQHSREQKKGYILGMYRHGTWSMQIGTGSEWLEVWSEEVVIPRDRWSFIAAVFDGDNGRMALYLNGKAVARSDIPKGTVIKQSKEDFVVGKNNQAATVHRLFSANMFNGLMDELKLYGKACSQAEIAAHYQLVIDQYKIGRLPLPDTSQHRCRYIGDRHRPKYHFIPPEHWMNEPHGPLYFSGQYHIFYQHNPQGPYWNQIHWGHAVSSDMVHWRDLPFALSPEKEAVDPDGCWSGSTAVDDGVPVIFYAAGDHSKSPNQSVGYARSTFKEDGDPDLKNWVKHPERVVIQKKGIGLFGEFRDPFVWKEDHLWYMLVTSGIPGEGGTALLYTSEDLINWTYRNPLYVGDVEKYPKTGDVWELPVFFPLGTDKNGKQKHILIINPWFAKPSPHYCKYIFYWIGTWDKKHYRFIPDDEEPQVMDVGEHFIGPSGLIDDQGRIILFSVIFGMSHHRGRHLGWSGNAGLPIVLSLLENGRLGVEPIAELQSLRKAKVIDFQQKTLMEANELLRGIQGDLLEIKVEMMPGEAIKYGVEVRTTPDGQEGTVVYVDTDHSTLNADRSRSSVNPEVEKGIEGGLLELEGNPLKLHIYLDCSMVEAYANGLKMVTTRIFPEREDALGIQVVGEMSTMINSMEVWILNPAYEEEKL